MKTSSHLALRSPAFRGYSRTHSHHELPLAALCWHPGVEKRAARRATPLIRKLKKMSQSARRFTGAPFWRTRTAQ